MEKNTGQIVNEPHEPKDIYELFDQFLNRTIIEKKNFFHTNEENINEENIFDAEALNTLVEICKSLKSGFKTEDINNEIIKQKSDQVKKIYGHI